jgi:hypothetical protein
MNIVLSALLSISIIIGWKLLLALCKDDARGNYKTIEKCTYLLIFLSVAFVIGATIINL